MLNSPKLTGQEDWYIRDQLINFKDGLRGSHEKDFYGKQMVPMMQTLEDEESIIDMVSYLSSLPQSDE